MPEVRLIDADALIQNHCGACANKEFCAEESCPYYEIRRRIETAPTIAAEPVKHGRLDYRHEDDWCYCSVCGTDAEGSDGECLETKYCPNCVAKMDGGAENG